VTQQAEVVTQQARVVTQQAIFLSHQENHLLHQARDQLQPAPRRLCHVFFEDAQAPREFALARFLSHQRGVGVFPGARPVAPGAAPE
jgi:hypothetical protein